MHSVADSPRLRRLDHVAIAVRDTDEALRHFRDRLGLPVVHQEDNQAAEARLTYLDAGNAYLQLVQPLNPQSPLAQLGEGLHHICFGVEDVAGSAAVLAGDGAPPVQLGSGRGRPSAFVPGPAPHGVRIEFTELVGD
jgi:methylmalonyl-CoA/ethylmalonyl-CoA epimerase